jgi:hypothetical protein
MVHQVKAERVLFLAVALLMLAAVPVLASESVFLAGIDGTEEVPPTPVMNTGYASLFLNEAQTQVSYFIEYETFGNETAAHFHMAAPGSNGPVVFPLPLGSPKIGVWNVTPADVAALFAGNIYVNIHNQDYPGGAIRGNFEFCAVPVEAQTWSNVKTLFR